MNLKDFLKERGLLTIFRKRAHDNSTLTYKAIDKLIAETQDPNIFARFNMEKIYSATASRWVALCKPNLKKQTLDEWLTWRGLKELFISNLPPKSDISSFLSSTSSSIITSAFTWSKTRQGFDIWNLIDRQWRENC